MKRKTVHCVFAAATCCIALVVAWQASVVIQHQRSVAAVSAVPETIETPIESDHTMRAEVLLASADALSKGEQFEEAERLLVRLIDDQKYQPLGQAARFNLANHYLRQVKYNDMHGAQAKPLIEIAKQRYRDLLRAEPDDWDARYNLEIALRLAPEQPENTDRRGPPPKKVRVIVPDFQAKDLP